MIHYIDSFPGREIVLHGKKHLYFGGTSYLGLQTDPEFQRIVVDNIRKYGTSYGASRKSNVRIAVFEKAEGHLARLVGSEGCVTMSSGYLAAQLLVQCFDLSSHKLFYAPHTHSALCLPNSKTYATYTALNIALREHLSTFENVTPVLLLDSIDFSGCNYPDFEGLKDLPLNELILIADDSHGIGLVGEKGAGVFNTLKKLDAKETIVCCSLGKALATQAGAIFGTKKRIESLKATDFYGGASPPPPASMASLLEAEDLYFKKREQLKDNVSHFTKQLARTENFLYMKDYPVFSFNDQNLSAYLGQNAIITTNFSYPSDSEVTKSRIVLSAHHNEQDILRLSTLIGEYGS